MDLYVYVWYSHVPESMSDNLANINYQVVYGRRPALNKYILLTKKEKKHAVAQSYCSFDTVPLYTQYWGCHVYFYVFLFYIYAPASV